MLPERQVDEGCGRCSPRGNTARIDDGILMVVLLVTCRGMPFNP